MSDQGKSVAPRARRCNIFFFDGWIGVAPTVIGLAQMLARAGYEVDVYSRRTAFADTGDLGEGIRIHYVDLAPRLLRRPRVLARLIEFARFLRAWHPAPGGKPDIHVGVDAMGALLAAHAARRDGGPIVHLSLELDLGERRAVRSWLLRRLFRGAYAKSVCCVVQDRERFDALSRALGCVHPRPFFVPNAPTSATVEKSDSNYFREVLALPADEFPFLIVHAGVVEDIVYSKEIAAAFSEVDLGCALVFHERTERDPADPYLVQLRERNRRNLFLSLKPVPFDTIDRVFAAATIGLAFYRPVDANLTLMAKASGKLAFHLKHGTPMIMNDLPSMVALNERYGFGVTIHDPSSGLEMREAVRYCLDNHARLSANARLCFEQEFQLEGKAAPFLQFVSSGYPA
ncbi:conserved hypothetical protein [Rubrivivax sp. A210]|uniref:glycosyltransferase n=1 Tax=Rubrivivax sp. A210 TaxID=2772301 RepID=UPI001918161C|nr:glycosyltransferase [Rubrivivax sp. A210]CAD5372636.1 conserved hypothetical protein [Rubrivivax sp. A210]